MLALGIILAVILLLLILPVGVDLRYEGSLTLKLKAGPLKFTLLPGKKKPQNKKSKDKPSGHKAGKAEKKPKQKLTLQDVRDLLRIGLKALGRLRRGLSIDVLRLHMCVAADDPYDAVMRYGALNAGLGVLAPLAHNALKIRKEDVRTDVDVSGGGKSSIALRLQTTLQIWEILWIALCAGGSFLRWNAGRKKAAKAATVNNDNQQEEKAS